MCMYARARVCMYACVTDEKLVWIFARIALKNLSLCKLSVT